MGSKGAGKDTVADYLKKYNFTKLKLADPVKDITAKFLNVDRKLLEGDTKESREFRETYKDPIWGKTPRHWLQFLGTDLFRNHFDPETWIKMCFAKAEKLIKENKNVVIADCRFVNEIEYFKKIKNCKLWLIARDKKDLVVDKTKHVTEWEFLTYPKFDQTILNSSTIDDLKAKIDALVKV